MIRPALLAEDIEEAVFAELRRRKGLGHLLAELDGTAREELRCTLAEKIEGVLRAAPPVVEVGRLLAFYRLGNQTATLRAVTEDEAIMGYVVRVDGPDGEWTYRQHYMVLSPKCWDDFGRAAGLTEGSWVIRRAVCHPTMGVSLAPGLWSKQAPGQRTEAHTFSTVGEARNFIDEIEGTGSVRDQCTIYPVIVGKRGDLSTATVAEIEAAGLPGWG